MTSLDPEIVTLHVPFRIAKRGGRKEMVSPAGVQRSAPRPRVDNTTVKALARAFRWQKMLAGGVHATVADIASAERINASYVSRVLRLTLLSPDIVETILDGRQGPEASLAALLKPFPVEWERQKHSLDPLFHELR